MHRTSIFTYFKCRDIKTSEIAFVDTDSDLDVRDVFYFKGRALKVMKVIDHKSRKTEKIPCDDLKLVLHVT